MVIKREHLQIALSIYAIGLIAMHSVIETSATSVMSGIWDPVDCRAIANLDFTDTGANLYNAPGREETVEQAYS